MEFAAGILPHAHLFVVLALHTELDPPAAEWNRVLSQLIRVRLARRISVNRIRLLVVSDGGAPNALQRQRYVRELHDGEPCKVAVITSGLSNPVKRGIATALSWINPSVRFFVPSDAGRALSYLDLRPQCEAIHAGFQVLQRRLRPVLDLARASYHLQPPGQDGVLARWHDEHIVELGDSADRPPSAGRGAAVAGAA